MPTLAYETKQLKFIVLVYSKDYLQKKTGRPIKTMTSVADGLFSHKKVGKLPAVNFFIALIYDALVWMKVFI